MRVGEREWARESESGRERVRVGERVRGVRVRERVCARE